VAVVPPFGQIAVWRNFDGAWGDDVYPLAPQRLSALKLWHGDCFSAKRGGVRTLPFRRLRNSFPAGLMRTLPSPTFIVARNHTLSRFA
jgi:hypothetical protein